MSEQRKCESCEFDASFGSARCGRCEWERNVPELLQQVAAGINRCDRVQVACIEVVLYGADGEELKVAGLTTVLDWMANGIYWDEEDSWASARVAEVRTM
jgi:hypothetical protein